MALTRFTQNVRNVQGLLNRPVEKGAAVKAIFDKFGVDWKAYHNEVHLPELDNLIADCAPMSHVGATGVAHGLATDAVNGFLSRSDKIKLDGIAYGATNYTHPSDDGNLHVPTTSTTNNGKALIAGASAGSMSWTTLTATMVGLGNVTNESKATMLASAALTGTPTAPTAAADTNTTQVATTAFVVAQAGSASPVMNGTAAVGTSLRFARQDHIHPTDTSRAPLASPTFTGTVSGITAAMVGLGNVTNESKATMFTNAALTSVPTAPTASADTNTTQIATTAFVVGQAGSATPAADGTAAVGTSLKFARQDHVHPTNMKWGTGTFTAGGTSYTLSDAFITSGSFVQINPTGAKLGNWTWAPGSGQVVITSSATESGAVAFSWACWK